MIQKPNVVKGIPTMIIRALPTLYYFGRYADGKIPNQAKNIFDSYLKYLDKAIKELIKIIPDKNLDTLSAEILSFNEIKTSEIESAVFNITSKLSKICQDNSEDIKQNNVGPNGLKMKLEKLFCDIIPQTKVLLVDNNNQQEWVESLEKKLTKNCYYKINKSKYEAEQFSDQFVNNDFIVFTSAAPQSIHEDIELLKTYKKPGLVLGNIEKDGNLSQQTIRNGSWLKSRGFDVLFKIFSPLRLFTTIDKINIRFLLQEN